MINSQLFGQLVIELGRFMSPPPPPLFFFFFLNPHTPMVWQVKCNVHIFNSKPIVFYPFQRLSPLCHRTHYKFYSLTMYILFEAPNCHSKATNIFSFLLHFSLFSGGGGGRPVMLALPQIFFFQTLPLLFHWPVANF